MEIQKQHSKRKSENALWRSHFFIPVCVIALVVCIGSLCVGRYGIGPLEAVKILLSRIIPMESTWTPTMENVVFRIRLPRMLVAAMVGGALSLSGSVYQGIFKNPLVSPDLLGVSSGACVGAAIAILLGLGGTGIQILALIAGLLAVLMTTMLPRLLKNRSTMVLVLSGIIVSGFFGAVMGIIKFVADPQTELAEITYWTMGSIAGANMQDVFSVLPAMAVAAVILLRMRWRVNLLSLGDGEAKTLGVNIRAVRGLMVLCSTILTACAVCISGTIGWVGLVVPHLSRMLAGPNNTQAIPFSLVMGAAFMVVVDTLARTVTVAELPLSIVTSFIGAPLYAWMLTKQRMRIK
ncbi:MAG: iron ABC transporter permease [Bacillota bacterium]|nr:MAG: iron ABC transporter permease [Bacillota bacterium]